MLKQPGSGWTYEGIAFRALVPTKSSCYPGTTPVWRLYNDRFAKRTATTASSPASTPTAT